MEVHAHTHTARKKWTHYFWEFFMLFLAIILGFFVENRREHYIEHKREKEYARLMYDDLNGDLKFLQNITNIKKWRANKLDSLFIVLQNNNLQDHANDIYYYSWFTATNIPYTPNSATFKQLSNSGNLRYFKKLKLYNSVTQYYDQCDFYQEREKTFTPPTPSELFSKIFSGPAFYLLGNIDPNIMNSVRYPDKPLKLLSTDTEDINALIHYAGLHKMSNELSLMLLGYVEQLLKKLIKDLEAEYHLSERTPSEK